MCDHWHRSTLFHMTLKLTKMMFWEGQGRYPLTRGANCVGYRRGSASDFPANHSDVGLSSCYIALYSGRELGPSIPRPGGASLAGSLAGSCAAIATPRSHTGAPLARACARNVVQIKEEMKKSQTQKYCMLRGRAGVKCFVSRQLMSGLVVCLVVSARSQNPRQRQPEQR